MTKPRSEGDRHEVWSTPPDAPITTTPAAADGPLLQVKAVSFSYGKHQVLDGVSFDVRAGEFVGVIGPNGSGKSTLLTLLMNLHHPTRGRVEFRSSRVDGLATPQLVRLGIGKTFQNPRVFKSLSVIDNMMVGARGRRRERRRTLERAVYLIETVKLSRHLNARAGSLSVGQQKLLDLARALLPRPKILLLDEVTAGVHPDLIPTIMDASVECVNDGGSIILITHELGIARHTCTRLLGLHNGRIIADGRPADVLVNEGIVEAYLGV